MAMCGTAYMAHFRTRRTSSSTPVAARWSRTSYSAQVDDVHLGVDGVRRGFALSVLLNVAVMVAGYLTFGASSQGLVLNNYAVKDA